MEWPQVCQQSCRLGPSIRYAAFLNHQSQITDPKQIKPPIQRYCRLPNQNCQELRPSSTLQRYLESHLGTLTPLIGVGLLGSVRFGVFENFKKELSVYKGTNGVPAQLELFDKTIAAFCSGLISSLLVVWHQLFSAQFNTQESESKSKEDKPTKSILARWMQL